MNFYDVLAAEKWDGGIPTINFFDLLFAQSISGEQWQTYEGTLPATINANGADLRQYQVWGNVGGVGDRTKNLFDKNATDTDNGYIVGVYLISDGTVVNSNNTDVSEYIPVSGNTAYILLYGRESGYYNAPSVCFYDISKNFISGLSYSNNNPKSFTTPAPATYVRLSYRRIDANIVILAKGSTAPASHVPYGYKLDIVSRTRNLFDISSITHEVIDASGAKRIESGMDLSGFIEVDGDYTVSWKAIRVGAYMRVSTFDENKNFIERVTALNTYTNTHYTNSHTGYIRINYENEYGLSDIMLNVGSTALPYEPYSNTTTPIYIGDEPLWAVNNYADYTDYQKQKVVRAIKKYVLTGEESWEEITGTFASRTYFRYVFGTLNYCVRHACISSHFTQTNITTATTTVGFDVFDSTSVNGEVLAIRPSGVQSTTLEDFKAWLAEQYAAGTPVTVWCALTVAEEADPPVTLPALPTVDGTTIVDYAGQSVAPKKVLLEYAKGGN